MLLVFCLIILGCFAGNEADDVNIVMFTKADQYQYNKYLETSIRHSIAYLNTRVVSEYRSGLLLNVQIIQIGDRNLLDSDFLHGKHKYQLGNASFLLAPYHINQLCELGELLKIPVLALSYEPGIVCDNVFSMRPDPVLMNQAIMTMIRDSRPRAVAVVIEAGYGDFATAIMSYEQHLNYFAFQIIAVVNFNNTRSVTTSVKELKESGTRKVLLVMQQHNVAKFMKEVHEQSFVSLNAYRWYTPVLDTSNGTQLRLLEGFMSLSLPIDAEEFNKTFLALQKMRPSELINAKEIDPLLHDALAAIAYATIEFKNLICVETQQKSPSSCLIPRTHRMCKSSPEHLSKVMFRGLTGDVKFTESRYRNITVMNADEVNVAKKVKLGVWTVACESFKWNPDSTIVKLRDRVLDCKSDKEEKKISPFKPRKRNLRVVARIEEPFISYDASKPATSNERFYGFCKDILDKLSIDLDFKYEMYLVPDGKYGSVDANNSKWNGMIGELISKEADIAVGALTLTSARENVIDFSKPFMDYTLALLMKKPSDHSKSYFEFLTPFSAEIWLSIFISTVAVALIMFFVERFSPFGYRKLAHNSTEFQGNEFNLANSFWFVAGSLLQQGPDQTPRSTAGRVLSTSFWFFVTIIMATYVASLAAHFTVWKPKDDFRSLEDLINQDSIKYGILRDSETRTLFQSSKYPLYRKINKYMTEKNTFQSSVEEAVTSVRKGKFAFLGDQPVLEYFNNKQPCDTKIVKYLVHTKSYAFGLRLSSEWTNLISVHLLHLRETGYIESLRMKWWNDLTECLGTKDVSRTTVPLGLRSIAGIIAILALGVCLSLFLLVLELKFKAWTKCLRSKQPQIPRKEKQVIKAPQITYLDYKTNGESYDLAFSKLYGSKGHDKSSLTSSYDDQQEKLYKNAPESTL